MLGWFSLRGDAGRSFSAGRSYSQPEFLVPAAGAIFSLWIWRRFGFSYAFLAAMIFVIFLPGYWTVVPLGAACDRRCVLCNRATAVVTVRSRHRFDYLDEAYSLVEALLWLGIYLAINLQLSSLDLPAQWWGGTRSASRIRKAVLLDHVGADLVPAANRAGARHSPEGPLRHCGGRDRRRPDSCLQ